MTAGFLLFTHGQAVAAAAETDLWRWHTSQQSISDNDQLVGILYSDTTQLRSSACTT